MEKKSVCTACGQSLVNGSCVNRQCTQCSNDQFGSLVPDEIGSMDPTQIVDYTGTLGLNHEIAESIDAASVDPDGDSDTAQTRMVDDDFYKQIREFFPADDSGSKSSESADAQRSEDADATRSLNVPVGQGVRNDYSVDEFVPPVRDIRFPADSAAIEELSRIDRDEIAGDEYQVVEKLGEGGYGVVFEAEQVALNRPVAVKVLKSKRKKAGTKGPSRSGTGTGEIQRRRDQFLHEAKITARLQHPNIVPLYDFGINTEGELFYSMKKVERRPWSSIIQDHAKLLDIPASQVDARAKRQAINKNVEIFDRVCDAMAYSHAQQIIHRDLKPDNIMIGDYGEVLLIDFGMALDFAKGQPDFSAGGTLVYMAPEMAEHFAKQKEIQLTAQKTAQKLGLDLGSVFLDQSNLLGIGKLAKDLIQKSKDQGVIELAETLVRLDSEERSLASKIGYASDIYLLGAILYQIAVGHPPHYFPISACKKGRKEKFQKELWLALRNGFQQYQEVTDPLRISLRNIAVRAMRTDPANRFQTVEELKEAIRGFQLEVQSLEMTETGKEELNKATGGRGYAHLLPALESFRGANELWPESEEAKSLQVQTACEYANRANNQKDFDAGLSILDEYVFKNDQASESVVNVRKKLVDGKKRRARNRKLAWASSIAAIVLPAGFFIVFSALASAQGQKLAESKQKLETSQSELVDANNAIASAAEEVTVAQASAVEATEKAQADIRVAEANAQEKIRLGDLAAEEKIAVATRNSKEKIAEADRVAAEKIRTAERESELEIAVARENAETEIAAAVEQVKRAKKEAEEYAFDAEIGVFNSNVLTIPLDLRTNKLSEARSKLESLAQSTAKPAFKNGWAVKHFAKRANVAGTNRKLSDGTRVVDIAALPNSNDSIVVGIKNGQPLVWRMQPDGNIASLDLPLPSAGTIVDISVSADGQWLALAVDDIPADQAGEHLSVINLNTGAKLNLAAGDDVVGCRVVEFSDTPATLQLVTVEELNGNVGLINRVQVVTRSIQDNVLAESNATPVAATTRGTGRVRYRADARWESGESSVGLAYQALDQDRNEITRMETLTPDGRGGFRSSRIETENFPSSIHLAAGNRLYSGYANGSIEQWVAGRLVEGATELNQLNENEVVLLQSADDGKLIGGSINGALVIRNADDTLYKKLQGQPGRLSALATGPSDSADGFSILSGDVEGNVRFWKPETGIHDATIRKNSPITVTSGAVDAGLDAGVVPATAFGTAKGQVYYYNTEAMLSRNAEKQIGDSNHSGNATFRFKSPFESFDSAFNDFDSMGIVGDHFVLLKGDGTFFFNLIDTVRKTVSAQTGTVDLSGGQRVPLDFTPLLASVPGKDFFFTTNPQDGNDQIRLIFWEKSGTKFNRENIDLDATQRGRVKRLSMSPDGNWLAVVRMEGRNRLAGRYVVEMYDISSGTSSIRLATPTNGFQVGDPAFVGFSPESREMILHFHKGAPDRQTWIERWTLTGQTWNRQSDEQKISNRKVDLVDWDQSSDIERMVTKANKNFFLVRPIEKETFEVDEFVTDSVRARFRSVRPTGVDNQYYVLSSDRLNLYTGTTPVQVDQAPQAPWIGNARDMRVFGNHVVMLDQNGFHLIDSELNYVTKLAARVNPVQSLSLSSGRLAILYSNKLCRIWDVRGDVPSAIGQVANAESVSLSPDGQWAVCQVDNGLQVFPIGSKFVEPKTRIPVKDVVFRWTGGADSNLLVAENLADRIGWTMYDPATGQERAIQRKLPTDVTGVVAFDLAPRTGEYVAIESKFGLSLWALNAGEPVRLNQSEHQFDGSKLTGVEAFSFSETAVENLEDTGTRLVVLASDVTNVVAEPRIYMLAKESAEPEENGGEPTMRYRVVEIEGAFEKREGRNVIDSEFSGDGRSLIQVDAKGISTLLSE